MAMRGALAGRAEKLKGPDACHFECVNCIFNLIIWVIVVSLIGELAFLALDPLDHC